MSDEQMGVKEPLLQHLGDVRKRMKELETIAAGATTDIEWLQYWIRRHRIDEVLQESEDRYRQLVESSPVGIAVYIGNKIVFINPAGVETMGASHMDDLVGKPVLRFVHPDSVALVKLRMKKLLAGETLEPVEEKIITPNGRTLYLEVVTSRIMYRGEDAVLAILHDITAHKLAEAEIAEALAREKRLNEIARTISSSLELPALLPAIVKLTAELVAADAGAVALVDADRETLSYPYLFNLLEEFAQAPRQKGEGLAWHIMENGRSLRLDNYSEHPQALPYWVRAGAHAFIGAPLMAQDTCLGVLVLFHQTPDRVFSERDLALVEAVALQAGVAIHNAYLFMDEQERANALDAALAQQAELDRLKDEFIQNASHELRTPLAISNLYIELVKQQKWGALPDKYEEIFAILDRRMQGLAKLVNNLMGSLEARELSLQQEPIDLAELVPAVVSDYRILAEAAGLTLSLKCERPTLIVTGSPSRLHQVIDNLLDNALKFTPSGGEIVVRLEANEHTAVLEVEDSGIGIPSDQLTRIFERFYQINGSTTRTYGGVGFGLALVKEVVEAHQGQVCVDSRIGEGSTFQVLLPLHSSDDT